MGRQVEKQRHNRSLWKLWQFQSMFKCGILLIKYSIFFSNCCQYNSIVNKYQLNATCELIECHHLRCCGEYKTNVVFTLTFIVLKSGDGWSKGRKKFFLLKKKSKNGTRLSYSKGLCLIHLYVPQSY